MENRRCRYTQVNYALVFNKYSSKEIRMKQVHMRKYVNRKRTRTITLMVNKFTPYAFVYEMQSNLKKEEKKIACKTERMSLHSFLH